MSANSKDCKHTRAYDPDGDTCCYDCGKVLTREEHERVEVLMFSARDKRMMALTSSNEGVK